MTKVSTNNTNIELYIISFPSDHSAGGVQFCPRALVYGGAVVLGGDILIADLLARVHVLRLEHRFAPMHFRATTIDRRNQHTMVGLAMALKFSQDIEP